MNNKSKHTPGPWTMAATKTNPYSWAVYGGEKNGVCFKTAHCLGLKAEANAQLISAAPELLAALEAVLSECCLIHRYGGSADNSKAANAAEESARAAIAKAKGE